jgi:diguanylate cyclase (GGDEF)-like protein
MARTLVPRAGRWLAGLGLLGRFSLLSVLALVALGAALSHLLASQISSRALSNAAQSASLISRFGIQPQLSDVDLREGLAPEAVQALDALLKAGYTSDDVETISVWNRAGRTIYSNDHHLIGRSEPEDPRFIGALEGKTSAHVKSGSPKLIEVYVPLHTDASSRPTGAFQIYLHYGEVAGAVKRDAHRLYLLLTVGLLVLWGALFRIAAGASRRLRRQANENEFQARHDPLTALPNRAAFIERVDEAIEHAEPALSTAVLAVDLDRFKDVNEALGYQSGDGLLCQAAERLLQVVRSTDTVARLGNDEFAVLLPDISHDDAAVVSTRARAALEDSFVVDGLTIDIEASAGLAFHPEHAADSNALMQRADLAMHKAKESRSGQALYEPAGDQSRPARLSMLGELRRAIDSGALVLHFQPKADLATGEVNAAEALVRWIHPERGMVPPGEFIPLAEHTGLIKQLSTYVLAAAIRQCADWRGDGIDLAVAVNLSARNLADSQLPDEIAALLAQWQVPAGRLCVEITESTIMAEPERAMHVLSRLSAMGVRLAIDDFGTGYSSLAYLKRLDVDEIKIDRTFVAEMDTDEDDATIVRSTIDLARNLGLRVVAEGVETHEVWQQLTALGCDFAQGYFLSRPLPPAQLAAWLRDGERPGAPIGSSTP